MLNLGIEGFDLISSFPPNLLLGFAPRRGAFFLGAPKKSRRMPKYALGSSPVRERAPVSIE
jgi:hypothetical protein